MKALVGISSEQDIESIAAFIRSTTHINEVIAVSVVSRSNPLSSVVSHPRRLWRGNMEKLLEIEKTHAAELLDQFKGRLEQPETSVETSVVVGNPAEELVKTARQQSADLIVVMRQQDQGDERGHLGSVASRVARYAQCSVLLLNPRQSTPKTVMFATDGSSRAAKASLELRELGLKGTPTLLICTIAPAFNPAYVKTGSYALDEYQRIVSDISDQEEAAAKELLAKAEASFRRNTFKVRTMFYTGDVVKTLLELVRENNVDLLAVGSAGVSNLERFLVGSTTLKILDRARCSILVGR